MLQAAHANPSPQEAQCSRTLKHCGSWLPSGFWIAPGASATKQPLAFCDCRWDLLCSGALAPAAPLADRGAALADELMGLQCQSRQGPSEGSCAAQAQGCFQRAGRDTGYQLSEILVRESQGNPTVPAALWSVMEQRCPCSLPRSNISSQVRGAAGPWVFLGVSQGAGSFRPLCPSVAQAKTLLWPDSGGPSLVGQVVLVGKSHQQLPGVLVLSC